ncbi:MAG: hypothetical protein QOE79_1008 [Sphingomonadales bacterium]|jgi:hypothetical protein|nr:hypothetical protein [Sphingomonadales bacterium]
MNPIIRFFDLYSQYRPGGSHAQADDGGRIKNSLQWIIYGACLVGIFAGPFALGAVKGSYPTIEQLFGGWAHVGWSILFAFVLTALLFKMGLKPTTPVPAQIGTALAVGMMSGKLVPLALETLTRVAS